MSRPLRWIALAVLLAAAAGCSAPGAFRGTYRPDGAAGPFRGAEGGEVVLRDFRRAKDLRVSVSYPAGDGPFPIIVFSHGGGANGRYPYPLTRFWTSHGYVCVHPTHADSASLGGMKGPRLAPQVEWEDRARDVSFVLDALDELERKVDALAGRLDAGRIGVAGHSYGGFTTQLVGGATVDFGDGGPVRSFEDPRPRAFLVLSGPGSGRTGLTGTSWDGWTRPLMAVTGSLDAPGGGRPPRWRLEPFERAPAGDKYGVLIAGAAHLSFTGRLAEIESSRAEEEAYRQVRIVTLAFLDAYVKEDSGAKSFLQTAAIPGLSRR